MGKSEVTFSPAILDFDPETGFFCQITFIIIFS
jgi:hypothetical protein